MKTTIVVLFAFLVFLSLSCQKDSGVESAGNTTQKKITNKKGNTVQKDEINTAMEYCNIRVVQHFTSGDSLVLINHVYGVQINPNGQNYEGIVPFDYAVQDDGGTPPNVTVYVKYYWRGTSCSSGARFALFIIGDPNVINDCRFWTWRSKPMGEISGGYDDYYFTNETLDCPSQGFSPRFETGILYAINLSTGID